jgi:hypothetical protein
MKSALLALSRLLFAFENFTISLFALSLAIKMKQVKKFVY